MDPIQRHIWLREHQLPNQKPSKLMVTETQNLTRNQILTLQNFEKPRLFHAQSSKDQTNLQQTATDLQSPPHTLTTNPTQTPQPFLSFPVKRTYQDEQSDPNETKKQKSDNAPDESAINNDPPPQPPTPFNNSTTIIDPSHTENGTHEQPQTIKRKHPNQQQHTNEDVHEPKKQRLPHDLETQTRSELPTTYPFIPINTMVPKSYGDLFPSFLFFCLSARGFVVSCSTALLGQPPATSHQPNCQQQLKRGEAIANKK